MSDINLDDVSELHASSQDAVRVFLRKLEDLDAHEVLGWQLTLAAGSNVNGINSVIWQVNDEMPESTIEAFDFPNEDASDALAQAKLEGRFAIAYSDALINKVRRRLLITRVAPPRSSSKTIDRIIQIAKEEHDWFGGRKENEDEPSLRVRQY